jgi:hypothetical protein
VLEGQAVLAVSCQPAPHTALFSHNLRGDDETGSSFMWGHVEHE